METYYITNNCINIIRMHNKEEAIRLADNIKGAIYVNVNLISGSELLQVYSYNDHLTN